MKNENTLSIYCLSQPILTTEWPSLLGDKYAHALPFKWQFVDSIEAAQIVAWDGLISPKSRSFVEELQQKLTGKVLILQGEAKDLFVNNPLLDSIDSGDLDCIEIPGWTVLPEQLLAILETCYQKLNHV